MKSVVIILFLALAVFSQDAEARLPKKQFAQSTTTVSSLETDESTGSEKSGSGEMGLPGFTSEERSSDESMDPHRVDDPLNLISKLLQMHMRNFNRVAASPSINYPSFAPPSSFFMPEPTIIRRTVLNRYPFQIVPREPDMSSMGSIGSMGSMFPRFPGFPQMHDFPTLVHPSMFDVDSEKVPEGYVKVNETVQGPEGHQVIHTVYEKKDTEGPNQFYGIIHKIRPYKPNNGSETSTKSNEPAGNPKKDEDRRIAATDKPTVEREVEESAPEGSKPEGQKKKTDDLPAASTQQTTTTSAASPEKTDSESAIEENKKNNNKSPADNEIPKIDSEDAPTITVNDNNQ